MSESLYHYGVKGMRWGKRKRPEERDINPREGDVYADKDGKEYTFKNDAKRTSSSKGIQAPKARTLSDAELRARINRIEMEQKYAKLTKVDYGPAMKFIGDILGSVIKDAATAGVKQAATAAWEHKGAAVASRAIGSVARKQLTG